MRRRWMPGGLVMVALVLAAVSRTAAQSETPGQSAAPGTERKWSFGVTPYLWLVGIDGTLKYDLPPDEEAEEADIGLGLEDLEFVFMVSAEARTERWSIITDLIHARLESTSDSVDEVRFEDPGGGSGVEVHSSSDTTTTLSATEVTLAGGYTLSRREATLLEAIAGVRYLVVDAESEWDLEADVAGPGGGQSLDREGSVSARVDLWDGIVGLRGELGLGSRFFIPFHADIGAGTSALTWQGVTGIGYRFQGWDVRLIYRYLSYDMDDDDLLQSVTFSGAAVGAKIRF